MERNPTQPERPEKLYIGATTAGIEEFEPRQNRARDSGEGARIFATPDRALAAVFMIENHEDSWTKIGYFGQVLVVAVRSSREDFLSRDRGGTLYEVSSEPFSCDPHKGMRDKEWTTESPVRPLTATTCSSVLDTLIAEGVQVYFVDDATFADICAASDHGRAVLASCTSENQLRGANVKAL